MNNEENQQIEKSVGQFLVYQAEDGAARLEVRLEDENLWLSINHMAELFGIDKSGISRHLKNIFETGELVRNSVVAKFATTAADGKNYQWHPISDLGNGTAERVHR